MEGVESGPARILFNPAGDKLAALFGDGSLAVWNVANWQRQTSADALLPEARSVSFSPDGSRLLAKTYRNARMWDAKTGTRLADLSLDNYGGEPTGFSPGGQVVVASSRSQGIGLWSATSGKPIEVTAGEKQIAVSARSIAVAASKAAVSVREINTGRELFRMADLPAGVHKRSSRRTASDWRWRWRTDRCFCKRSGAWRPACRRQNVPWPSPKLTFSADSRWTMIYGAGSVALLVDAAAVEVPRLPGHVGGVRSAFFSRDGRYAIISTDEGTKTVWDAATGVRRVPAKRTATAAKSSSWKQRQDCARPYRPMPRPDFGILFPRKSCCLRSSRRPPMMASIAATHCV